MNPNLERLDKNVTNGLNAAFRRWFYAVLSVVIMLIITWGGWVSSSLIQISNNRYTIYDHIEDQRRHNERFLSIERRLPTEFPPTLYEQSIRRELDAIKDELERLKNGRDD